MKKNYEKTSGLLTLLLFGIFALCVLGVLLTGARVYQRLVNQGEAQFSARVIPQYLATRVRQAQCAFVGEFGGCPALILQEGDYVTRIYLWDGCLRELYSDADADLEPEDGEKVLPCECFDISLKNGLLTVNTGDSILYLSLRTGKEAAP